MSDPRLPQSAPCCGEFIDAATDPFGASAPKAGDLSVCWYCTALLIFDFNLRVRRLSDAEFDELPNHLRAEMLWLRAAIADYKKNNKP